MSSDQKLFCPRCRYDISGLPDDVCPECGRPFDRKLLLRLCVVSWQSSRAAQATLVAALLLFGATSAVLFNDSFLSWGAFPAIAFLVPVLLYAAFGFSGSVEIACLIASSITFVLWNHQLLRGRPAIPRRTIVLLAILHLLNWGWLILQWRDTFLSVWSVSFLFFLILVAGCFDSRRYSRFVVSPRLQWLAPVEVRFFLSLGFHWVAWIWLTLFLFPHLGDFP